MDFIEIKKILLEHSWKLSSLLSLIVGRGIFRLIIELRKDNTKRKEIESSGKIKMEEIFSNERIRMRELENNLKIEELKLKYDWNKSVLNSKSTGDSFNRAS